MNTPIVIDNHAAIAELDPDTLLEVYWDDSDIDCGLLYTAQEMLMTDPAAPEKYLAVVLAHGADVRTTTRTIAQERFSRCLGYTGMNSVHTKRQLAALDPDTLVHPYVKGLAPGSAASLLHLVNKYADCDDDTSDIQCSAAVLVDGTDVRAARDAVAQARRTNPQQ